MLSRISNVIRESAVCFTVLPEENRTLTLHKSTVPNEAKLCEQWILVPAVAGLNFYKSLGSETL